MNYDHIIRALKLFAKHDGDSEDIYWHESETGELQMLVICNDVFWWGTADLEAITADNVALLEQCFADVAAIQCPDKPWMVDQHRALTLFCARIRKMRPQGRLYDYIDKELHPLFDAAGPERDPKEPGNTPRSNK